MNTYDLAIQEVKLKKASSSKGGEFHGPCPGCGGDDRFHVWPNEYQEKGGYWCRACGKAGDNIQFLIDFKGMDFKAACQFLNINIKEHTAETRRMPGIPDKPPFEPEQHQNPDQLWQEKAEKFVTWAQLRLAENADAIKWLASRGISAEAAVAARLGWNPGENGKDIFRSRTAWGLPELIKENGKLRMLWIPQGLVIPYSVDGIIQRIRIRRPEGEPRYYVIPGSSMSKMIIGIERRAFVVIESELDAIACAAATDLAGAIAMGTLEGKPDVAAYTILKDSIQILNALDYGDKDGGKKAAERAFNWWLENFPERCDRWPVPKGKDPGEAFQQGIDLKRWIEAGLPPIVTISRRETGKVNGEAKPGECRVTIVQEQECHCEPSLGWRGNLKPNADTPPLIAELWKLLRDNPSVKIINEPYHFTVLRRNDRYVGGRINELVMKPGEVNDYLLNHPDEEITWQNLLKKREE
jgi:hypothetical protein